MAINLSPNIDNPDEFYATLIAHQQNLDDDTATAFYARVIFLLANHIGDQETIMQALHLAAEDVAKNA